MINFGRFMRLIELIDNVRSSVHAGVLCLGRLTKRTSNMIFGQNCNELHKERKLKSKAKVNPTTALHMGSLVAFVTFDSGQDKRPHP